ncbi:glycosyltransferase [Desulforhabdus sp. TSK]|uniref:glycosyltransferase family 2 protein n=1 Tax=Desulforhabdus sp. TSK TaxID=2925014 RepID=UPI001FC8BC21|nr:glycosyltransferase [Desulforhabdus sp. TSK]GKT10877.1 hypothetical protein DSTSK_41820 [Desulforhabdus sp. TSK]
MELLFSVVIPAFNAEAYIAEAIESALNQIGVKIEVIVVDDGSTDNTLQVVESFKKRIRIIRQENMGAAAARNSAAQAAQGNVLAFLDADDIWMPQKLYIQSLKLNEGYKIVYTNRYNIGQLADLPEIQSNVVKMREGDIWEDLLFGNIITASSCVMKKECFRSLGGFRRDLPPCEDWDLWLRCAEIHSVGYCSEPLLKYRIHSGGTSRNYKMMSKMRRRVIAAAFCSHRGEKLPLLKKRQIMAQTWSTSAWDAAQAKDQLLAIRYYINALRMWPFIGTIWYDLARVIAGRI